MAISLRKARGTQAAFVDYGYPGNEALGAVGDQNGNKLWCLFLERRAFELGNDSTIQGDYQELNSTTGFANQVLRFLLLVCNIMVFVFWSMLKCLSRFIGSIVCFCYIE